MISVIKRYYPFLMILLLLAGCDDQAVKPPVGKDFKTEQIPDQESIKSKIVFSDSGIVKAVLTTGRVRMFRGREETLLDSGLVVDFFDPSGIKTTTLTSRFGRVNDKTKDLYAMGDVVVKSDSGTVLRTDRLMYRASDQKILTELPVEITSPTETIKGVGFESDKQLKNYVIYRITYVTTQAPVDE